MRNFTGKCSAGSLIAAPAAKGVFSGIDLDNVTLSMCADPKKISEYRWPCEGYGVLNVYRMPELDISKFTALPEGEHPAVLFRP